MQNRKAVSTVFIYLLLTTVLSSCSFLECKPTGKIQFKDFVREDMSRLCYDSGLLTQYDVCSKHSEVGSKIKSEPVVLKVIDKLKLTDSDNKPLTYKKFIENLYIGHKYKGKELIAISYQSSDKQQASEVVNTLMKTYIQEANRQVNVPFFIEQIRDREREIEERLLESVENNATETEMSDTGFVDSVSIEDAIENLQRMNSYLSIVEKDSDRENYELEIVRLADLSCSIF